MSVTHSSNLLDCQELGAHRWGIERRCPSAAILDVALLYAMSHEGLGLEADLQLPFRGPESMNVVPKMKDSEIAKKQYINLSMNALV